MSLLNLVACLATSVLSSEMKTTWCDLKMPITGEKENKLHVYRAEIQQQDILTFVRVLKHLNVVSLL